jgi:hypothetical protein
MPPVRIGCGTDAVALGVGLGRDVGLGVARVTGRIVDVGPRVGEAAESGLWLVPACWRPQPAMNRHKSIARRARFHLFTDRFLDVSLVRRCRGCASVPVRLGASLRRRTETELLSLRLSLDWSTGAQP